MRVAVVGARGQLGAAVVVECAVAHDVIALGRSELDVADDRAVSDVLARVAPDAIVNCAAYNLVDAAEDHPVDALNANAFGVRALARAASAAGAVLVHYSTDFVFDGASAAPYTEDDRPNPRSVYAASKLLGEWFAEEAPGAFVLRVESLFGRAPGGPQPRGTIATMSRQMIAGDEVVVFEDRTVTPTYALDCARATREILERRPPSGMYHCVNSGSCTWLEFAVELGRELGVEARLKRMKLAEANLRATRPQFCALSNAKLAAAGVIMPRWQDAVERYVKTLQV